MAKTFYRIYIPFLLALLAGLSSCSSSYPDDGTTPPASTDMVTLRLNLSTSAPGTRADGQFDGWVDGGAHENIKSWVVVIADQNNKILQVLQSSAVLGNVKQTDVGTVSLPTGRYIFYSFANLTMQQLGNPTEGQQTSFNGKDFQMDGNGFNPETSGIPMSNKQEVDVSASGDLNLWLVRMLAKVELNITNMTGGSVTIDKVTLTDITANGANNIKLLPTAKNGKDEVAETPNLGTGATKADYTYTLSSALTLEDKAKGTITFYVNESVANDPKYFVLSIGDNRYAMLEWNQIARNDYRAINITLDNYRVQFEVEQFTAIGVPPVVTLSHGTLSILFNDYGDFHIIPKVTNISTGNAVPYSNGSNNGWSMLRYNGSTEGEDYFHLSESNGNIYKTAPTWDSNLKLFEGSMAPNDGYAIHVMTLRLPSGRNMAVRTQIRMAMPEETQSASTRTARPLRWQRVIVSEK